MIQTEQLPKPNIQFFNDAELKEINEKIDILLAGQNESDLLEAAKKYPLPAKTLDDFKHRLGMDFLLRGEFNLANAVKEYGEDWLES